ncbi:Pre-rRNA-processing protein ipi3 [Tulasnella sp. JGI-2019a]|nr:Pre-rRNA-processing protein ipi3 [Tulasnella sp. JGI-2019a]KAG9003896.1 Pre-rRNA-processing protein ipi3 [Tulasnella sp. JGI-2019a]KAG9031869.1 Pre-rRNA-processing protein ipi3 [Tulasnella sp. JGI-2019a]
MKLREVFCCSTAPSSAALGTGSITLHDIQTGTQLACFKQTSSAPHCIGVVQGGAGLGGLILSVQSDKPILNIYSFQKEQLHMRIVLPEKLSCMASDIFGRYFAGGTSTGRIYLWEIASGILFNSFEAHYRQTNVLRFTTDGAALISGSEDSGVSVWAMSHLLDNDKHHEMPTPYCSLPDHTLPITDIACGVGPFPSCRVLTSSLDNSCKLWDTSTKTLLSTFLFPRPISIVVLDPAERMLFAASSDGFIHQVNLLTERKDHMGRNTSVMEAVSGLSPSDVTRMDDNEQGSNLKRLITVGQEILSMTLSMTGSILLIGTVTGHVHLYDVASHQLLKTVNTHQSFRATHLSTFIKPLDLVGHITLGSTSHLDAMPVRPITSFHRIRDAAARTAHGVPIMLPISNDNVSIQPGKLPPYDLEADHRYFFAQSSSAGASGQSLQIRVVELEAEVENLRRNLSKAKGLNDSMWESVVNTVLKSDAAPLVNGNSAAHPAKRSKTKGL